MLKKILILLLLFIIIFSFLRIAFRSGIDADEIEHTHISWLINNGQLPYQDIHQIHMPLLWIVTAPILKILPEKAFSIYILRGLTIIFFLLSVFVGGKILKDILNISNKNYLYYYYIIIISLSIPTEFFRFRPDVFMSFFSILGVFILLKYIKYQKKRVLLFLSGLFFGIALSFSLKILPFLLLYPLIDFKGFSKVKLKNFMVSNIFHFSGMIVGVIPSLLWILDKQILHSFFEWVIVNNFQMKDSLLFDKEYILAFIVLLFIIIFINKKYNLKNNLYYKTLSVSLLLSFSIRIIDPNHLSYNWQLMIIILSIILTLFFKNADRLELTISKHVKTLLLIIIIILVSIPSIIQASFLYSKGWLISKKNLDVLISLRGNNNEECVGLSPYHPIFCKDSTSLYLLWDYYFILRNWVSKDGKSVYKKMWQKAIKEIIIKKPKIIVAPHYFDLAYKNEIISKNKLLVLNSFTKKFYKKIDLGEMLVLVRKQ